MATEYGAGRKKQPGRHRNVRTLNRISTTVGAMSLPQLFFLFCQFFTHYSQWAFTGALQDSASALEPEKIPHPDRQTRTSTSRMVDYSLDLHTGKCHVEAPYRTNHVFLMKGITPWREQSQHC